MSEALFYKEVDNILYLRARGHITAGLCTDLRERVLLRLDTANPVSAILVDLSDCDYMDSTFLGLLVGFNKRLLRNQGKPISIVAPSASARELLAGLGIIALVEILDEAPNFPSQMDDITKTQNVKADMLLKAHENLMDLSEENRKKFAGLHSVLKNQQDEKLIPD